MHVGTDTSDGRFSVTRLWSGAVNKKLVEEVAAIEETQGALRESIEKTKALAEDADKLLKKHKANLKNQAGGTPERK